LRASLSLEKEAKEEGRRGKVQSRGLQSAREEAEEVVGCLPGGQEKGRERHWVCCMAPGEAVVFPRGHRVHWDTERAPGVPLNVPRGHCVGEEAEGPE